ncbi:mitogen-activated protein kinase HOG1 [Talaromyces proteolyticus]|uniref:Mitogen-activated protein kinase HOG1 n=1 Tax=Talaromyces proteolyticus TaxID=1131652 RepID=A0AAD4L311_9EURO|nr:mitogen-activated protein kinase HOG1 [Talaromyces proteolyticus]KAH8705681.1 mitogen-activated protein kinase HOG1 [Talaromyces proteolyticus]
MTEFIYSHAIDTAFEITNRYTHLQHVRFGRIGLVCSAKDQRSGQIVAVEKMTKPFSSIMTSKKAYRELKVLRHLQHKNVSVLRDVFMSPSKNIYVITEFVGTDLESILVSETLENKTVKHVLCQILRGLKYIHSAGIAHCNLSPSNILVDEHCDLRISNFGRARIMPEKRDYHSTGHPSSPQILLNGGKYDNGVDIWSAGCILAEMLEGKLLLPGKDYRCQFSSITELLGAIPDDVIRNLWGQNTLTFVHSLPKIESRSLSNKFKSADPLAVDLLGNMLIFDPRNRVCAYQALTYKYLIQYHDPVNEPISRGQFKLAFNDADLSANTWKRIIDSEIRDYHNTPGIKPV